MIYIISVVYNQPQFIEYQYQSLKKYIIGDFKYIVYDNSNDHNITLQFHEICKKLNITYVRVDQSQIFKRDNASLRAGQSLNFSIRHLLSNYKDSKYLFIIDSDMFLIEYIDIPKELENVDFIGIPQTKNHIIYYTNQLAFVNLQKCINFHEVDFSPAIVDKINGDCGVLLYNYFRKYADIRIGIFDAIHSNQTTDKNYKDLFPNKYFIEYFEKEFKLTPNTIINLLYNNKCFSEFYFKKKIMHLKSGSNWMRFPQDIINQRNNNLFVLLTNIL